jgi:hypothetical protein
MRRRDFVVGLAMLGMAAEPAWANVLTELTFQQKMEASDIVIVGTVASLGPGTANVRVLRALKGRAGREVVVSTTSRISELNPRCCTRGATYVLFLRRYQGLYHSVNGIFGMVMIGS